MKLINKSHLLFITLLLLHVWLSYHIQFTAWPEMLTYPWLMEHGFRLYGDIVHPYLPLLPITLFIFFKIVGFSIINLHILTLGVLGTIDGLIFYATLKKFGTVWASISTLCFIFLGLILEGNSLWFDIFGIPFIMGALLLLDEEKHVSSSRLLFSGLLTGLAILVKQSYIIFLLPILLLLVPNYKKMVQVCFGIGIPIFIVTSIFIFKGQFREFSYWGLWHPIFVHARIPGFALMPTKRELIFTSILFLPFILFGFRKISKLMFFSLCLSFLLAVPRFAYFHLIPSAAIASLLVPSLKFPKPFKLYRVGYALVVSVLAFVFITNNWQKPTRFFEPNVLTAQQQIVQTIDDQQGVYFYNVPSQYFVLTNILPIKPWVDTFPWYLEVPGVQQQIIESLEKTHYIVSAPFQNEGRFIPGSYKPSLIDAYIKQHFKLQMEISPQLLLLQRVN